METKEKPVLYYIKGVEGRQEECIKVLEEKGGQNADNLDGTCDLPCIYYIDEVNAIGAVSPDDTFGKFVMHYGEELKLPKKQKVLKWEDIVSNNKGLYQIIQEMDEDKETYRIASIWPTRRQALSAQAASLISQIREQGKEVYGEIVTYGELAYVIYDSIDNGLQVSVQKFALSGGLLRFNDGYQANLFLENNRELVGEYLKTF